MTSLDMGGIQITILQSTGKEDWIKLLDAETEALAWPGCYFSFEKTQVDIKIAFPEHMVVDFIIMFV